MLRKPGYVVAAALSLVTLTATAAWAQGGEPSGSPGTAYKQMGWGGIGVRIGYNMPKLDGKKLKSVPRVGKEMQKALDKTNDRVSAYNAGVDAYNAAHLDRPMPKLQPYSFSDLNVGGRLLEVTPVFHLGGDGYYWKFEIPLTLSPEFSSYGLGIYPINYGYYIESIGLFPYVSLGGALSYATATRYTSGSTEIDMEAVGFLAQARAAIGVKFYVASYLPMSVEFGYSPWAAGGVVDSHAVNAIRSPNGSQPQTVDFANVPRNPGSLARGGIGSMWNLGFGAEWL